MGPLGGGKSAGARPYGAAEPLVADERRVPGRAVESLAGGGRPFEEVGGVDDAARRGRPRRPDRRIAAVHAGARGMHREEPAVAARRVEQAVVPAADGPADQGGRDPPRRVVGPAGLRRVRGRRAFRHGANRSRVTRRKRSSLSSSWRKSGKPPSARSADRGGVRGGGGPLPAIDGGGNRAAIRAAGPWEERPAGKRNADLAPLRRGVDGGALFPRAVRARGRERRGPDEVRVSRRRGLPGRRGGLRGWRRRCGGSPRRPRRRWRCGRRVGGR